MAIELTLAEPVPTPTPKESVVEIQPEQAQSLINFIFSVNQPSLILPAGKTPLDISAFRLRIIDGGVGELMVRFK